MKNKEKTNRSSFNLAEVLINPGRRDGMREFCNRVEAIGGTSEIRAAITEVNLQDRYQSVSSLTI